MFRVFVPVQVGSLQSPRSLFDVCSRYFSRADTELTIAVKFWPSGAAFIAVARRGVGVTFCAQFGSSPLRAPSLPDALRRLHWAALHAPAAAPAVAPPAVLPPIQDRRPGVPGALAPELLLSADDFVGRYGVPAGHPPGADASAHMLNHLASMLPPAVPAPATLGEAARQKQVREARNAIAAIAGVPLPVVFPFPVCINVEKLADAWGRGR